MKYLSGIFLSLFITGSVLANGVNYDTFFREKTCELALAKAKGKIDIACKGSDPKELANKVCSVSYQAPEYSMSGDNHLLVPEFCSAHCEAYCSVPSSEAKVTCSEK